MSNSKTPRYAPANEQGEKPYLVEVSAFAGSNRYTRIVYANKPGEAEYQAKGRQMHTYAKARRATPADIDAHNEDGYLKAVWA